MDEFLDIKRLASRSSLCERNLRAFLKDPRRPLPHYRVGGKLLVYWPEFLVWMKHFRVVLTAERQAVDRIVDEMTA